MRRILQLSVLCLAASIVTACDLDEVIRTEDIPTAGVRFINAVPDTQPLDFRFVDEVESNAHWNIAFRDNPATSGCVTASTQIQYKPARAGDRNFRIFLNDTLQSGASQVIRDMTVTLEADKNYTALLWGYSRAGATPPMEFVFVEDNPPDPGPQVALRVINATGNAIDVRHYVDGSAVPAAPTFAGLAPLTASDYILIAPSRIRVNVRRVGGTSEPADVLALVGAPAQIAIDPLPGTTIAGSAVTAIVFPPSVPGSKAPQGNAALIFRPTTGASPIISATATGYARPPGTAGGSFLTDCFYVGGSVMVTGFANPANNTTSSIVTAVTAKALTVTKSPQTVVEKGTTGPTTLSATATGYARPAGSFIDDGFVVGQFIVASGFTNVENNGQSRITAITATDLTVTKTTGNVAEVAGDGRTIASAAARTISGIRPLDQVSFFWDRRPPRI